MKLGIKCLLEETHFHIFICKISLKPLKIEVKLHKTLQNINTYTSVYL